MLNIYIYVYVYIYIYWHEFMHVFWYHFWHAFWHTYSILTCVLRENSSFLIWCWHIQKHGMTWACVYWYVMYFRQAQDDTETSRSCYLRRSHEEEEKEEKEEKDKKEEKDEKEEKEEELTQNRESLTWHMAYHGIMGVYMPKQDSPCRWSGPSFCLAAFRGGLENSVAKSQRMRSQLQRWCPEMRNCWQHEALWIMR